ncbi:polymeric immunoglobulin receptor-like isoform X2 [Alosa pseudoharengus]|uniref:polymeric immunoglobulin receptor-like isoform X2 n=1 Tax=Alosa pseudoharengus TaxID=34774 RepID=UPI003F88DDA6
MALRQLVLFFLFLQYGLSDCSRISAVSVQEGRSAIIPCLYEKEHEDNTKLWCRKDNLSKCAAAVNSNSKSQSAAGVSISDDITHGIFTVNMTNIRHEDAGDYCCTVKPRTKPPQTKYCTEIKMSKDRPMLSVLNPMISGYESGTASVLFQHRFPGSKRQFCQLGGECVGWDTDSASLNGMSVMLSDVPNGELKVTLSGLQVKNTGWYVCSMGGFQTPVHLNVTGIGPTPVKESPETKTNKTAPKNDQRGMVEVLVPVGVAVLVLIVLCSAAVGLVQWRRGKREARQQAATDANSDMAGLDA